MDNNGDNNFNMNNPFLAMENNNTAPADNNFNNEQNNINSNIEKNIYATPKQEEDMDAVLGINLYNTNKPDENAPKPNELDNILGINNVNENNVEEVKEESKDQQLDSILGINTPTQPTDNVQNNINQIEDTPLPKAQKTLRNDMIVLLILEILIIGYTASSGSFKIYSAVFAIIALIGLFLTTINSKYSWVVGMFFGIGMILTIIDGDVIDALLGLFVIIHSILCILEQNKEKKKEIVENK